MHVDPNLARQIENQLPMFHWSVRQLADVPESELIRISIGDREANCIPVTPPREMRTRRCVTKVAEFP
jgi:hypothetical protein